jgi:hypothetical protein
VDTCCVGIIADTGEIPDPAELVLCVREGFREVLAAGGSDARVRLPLHDETTSKGGETPWR